MFSTFFDSFCSQKPLLQLAQTMRISYFKGKSGTTKVTVFSLAFLRYFGERTKSDGSHKFSITLCYFTAFQTRETWYLFSLSLFSLSLFLISLKPNTGLKF
jgi:hypothetical protein